MKLAIVGAVGLANQPEAWRLVRRLIHEHRPKEVVSGNGPGIDSMAIRAAKDVGCAVRVFKPEVYEWDGGDYTGFKQRALLIAVYCDMAILIGMPGENNQGSRTVLDAARALGKRGLEFAVTGDGEVVAA